MEILLGCALLYGLYRGGKAIVHTIRRSRHNAATNASLANRQVAQLQRQQALLNQHSREMQLAILSLDRDRDPDFRRAASAAQQARDVPAAWRKRQYHRLRPLLVRHYQRCLARGTDPTVLVESLTDLVEALGLEGYEADYISQEADRSASRRRQPNGDTAQEFRTRITQVQTEHAHRLEVIRALPNVSDEVRQQLLEAEDGRFQQALFGRET